MARSYDLKDAGLFIRDLTKDLRAAAERGLLAAAHRTVGHIVSSVIPATDPVPVDKGLYRAGWRARAIAGGALVYNVSPHAPIIEWGAKVGNIKIGRAMIDALAEWVQRKGIGSTVVKSRGGRHRVVKATDSQARGIAWAIAKKMQQRGIFAGGKGLRVLERAEKEIPRFIRDEVSREIGAL